MTIRTLIVDDEKPARDRLKRFLAEHGDVAVVGEAQDGLEAVSAIDALHPDLVILDVEMPEASGFEVLRRIKPPLPRVVFATAYERYAVQAFEVHSVDYLLKPFDRKRLGAALARVREEIHKSFPAEEKLDALLRELRDSALALRAPHPPADRAASGDAAAGAEPQTTEAAARPSTDRIPARRGQKISLLAPSEIQWFEAEGELVFARAGAHRYLVSRTLTELESGLDPAQFFRCHRSFIVNLGEIAEIVPEEAGNYRIIIRDPSRPAIPLSRRQARKLREVFPW